MNQLIIYNTFKKIYIHIFLIIMKYYKNKAKHNTYKKKKKN
jgi:hypothetical protein